MLHTSDRPFACDLCPSRFKWKAALKTHILVHTGQKPAVCDICGSSFTTKGSMKKHKSEYRGENSSQNCGCLSKRLLILGIHTGDRRYHCETCSMRFYSNDHLKRHKRTHTGERRRFSIGIDNSNRVASKLIFFYSLFSAYLCSYCPRSFSQSNDLTKHIRSHVGTNMYQCHCGASFRLQTELRKHSYSHYNKEEPSAVNLDQSQ